MPQNGVWWKWKAGLSQEDASTTYPEYVPFKNRNYTRTDQWGTTTWINLRGVLNRVKESSSTQQMKIIPRRWTGHWLHINQAQLGRAKVNYTNNEEEDSNLQDP